MFGSNRARSVSTSPVTVTADWSLIPWQLAVTVYWPLRVQVYDHPEAVGLPSAERVHSSGRMARLFPSLQKPVTVKVAGSFNLTSARSGARSIRVRRGGAGGGAGGGGGLAVTRGGVQSFPFRGFATPPQLPRP